MPELSPSCRAEIDALLYDETAPAGWLRVAVGELAAENGRLRILAAKQSVLLEQAQCEASTAIASSPPSRLSATPAEVDVYLRKILAEDTYLRYQQAIGGRSVEEAAKDIRTETHTPWASQLYLNGMAFAADHIDPLKGGGRYPSQLLCSHHNGFGPCPGFPKCTPSADGGER
ncbi:hypothetical protein [Streptomyces sp. NPDC059788]|uniref:hypothetical protein n=1 Tax=Streptomyces sp. NPDC059788 TaxID=3346948 RepID=UPI003646060E